MFELIFIAGGSFLVAVVAVWAVRTVAEWRAGRFKTVSFNKQKSGLQVGSQQGFVKLDASTRHFGLTTGERQARKPWGW